MKQDQGIRLGAVSAYKTEIESSSPALLFSVSLRIRMRK
jgi:hypothetical protein